MSTFYIQNFLLFSLITVKGKHSFRSSFHPQTWLYGLRKMEKSFKYFVLLFMFLFILNNNTFFERLLRENNVNLAKETAERQNSQKLVPNNYKTPKDYLSIHFEEKEFICQRVFKKQKSLLAFWKPSNLKDKEYNTLMHYFDENEENCWKYSLIIYLVLLMIISSSALYIYELIMKFDVHYIWKAYEQIFNFIIWKRRNIKSETIPMRFWKSFTSKHC